MARITIDCADPSDFTAIAEAAEKAAGRCNITYAKQAAALVDAGTVKSERAAAKQIAYETGESLETTRTRIKRGKIEMGSVEPKPKKDGSACAPEAWIVANVYKGAVSCLHALVRIIAKGHPGEVEDQVDDLVIVHGILGAALDRISTEVFGGPLSAHIPKDLTKADAEALLAAWKSEQPSNTDQEEIVPDKRQGAV